MTQPDTVQALDLPPADPLDEDMEKYLAVCAEKLGFVPNVLKAYAHSAAKLRAFVNFYNELMVAESGLTKLEREMIAVAVSSRNRCYYCQVAHGAAVRTLSGDAVFGEMMVMNDRAADLAPRHRAMLDFAIKMTEQSAEIIKADREALRAAGFDDAQIWDIAAVASFFNMTNRMASAVDMRPNPEYHRQGR